MTVENQGYARLLAIACALAAPVPAPAAPPAHGPVGLQEVLALALEHNTDLRSSGQDLASAHGALTQASLLPNPGLFVGSFGTKISPLGAPTPNQVGATWTIPFGGKRSAGIAAAEASVSAAKATTASVRHQLELNAATGFVNLLLAQALLAFTRSNQEAFHKTLALNELRYQAGKISFGEVLKLRIQALSIDDAVRQSEQSLIAARADLSQLVGEGALAPDFTVQGALDPPPQPPEVTAESLLTAALSRRPDYLALAEQEESAKHSLTQARRQPIPDLGVLVDYNHGNGNPDSYDLSLTIPVPLFDRNTGNIQQAQAALEKVRIAREALRNQLRDTALKAVAEWRSSSAQMGAYRVGEQGAQQSLEIARHSYELGRGSLLEFLDAETSYRQVESSFLTALARNALAVYTLRFTSGEDVR